MQGLNGLGRCAHVHADGDCGATALSSLWADRRSRPPRTAPRGGWNRSTAAWSPFRRSDGGDPGQLAIAGRRAGQDASFNLYRDGKKLNAKPLTGGTDFVDRGQAPAATYTVRHGRSAEEGAASAPAGVWADGYLDSDRAARRRHHPDGEAYSYTANDASVGDLDGDGRYELILKWDPTNAKDNAFGGYTGDDLHRRLYAGGQAPVAHRPGPQHPGRRALHPVPGL
jgi:hypothetical protein